MQDDSKEILLEEYRQLRTEIRHYLSRKSLNTNFAFILTLGIIGAGITFENYYLFLTGAILICSLWLNEQRRLGSIFRIGAYIEVIIESKLPELNWEHYDSRHKIQKSWLERLLANFEYPVLFLLNYGIGFIVLLKKIEMNTWQIILYSLPAVIILFLLLKRSFTIASKGRIKEVDFWNTMVNQNIKSHTDQGG